MGVPSDQGNGYRPGAGLGPRAVREASDQFIGPDYRSGVDPRETHRIVDAGDVAIALADPATTLESIKRSTLEVLDAGALPILIGGDHSITIGGFEGFAEFSAETPVALLSFDAHLDTEVDPYPIAACPVARAIDAGCDPLRIAIVGVRGSLNPRAWVDYAHEQGIRVHGIHEVEERGIGPVVSDALDAICTKGVSLYVTFDLDSVDPAYAPGVVTPEPAGLTSRELLAAARLVGARSPRMFDLVELAPAYDVSGITARLACAVISNVLGALRPAPGRGGISERRGGTHVQR